MQRAAAMRNMNPAQMAAATAASQANANMPNAIGMSGGSMIQRQAQQVNKHSSLHFYQFERRFYQIQ